MMMKEIKNMPYSQYKYEFMVIDNDYNWIANFEDANRAYDLAKKVNGRVVHDLTVCHKELKIEKDW